MGRGQNPTPCGSKRPNPNLAKSIPLCRPPPHPPPWMTEPRLNGKKLSRCFQTPPCVREKAFWVLAAPPCVRQKAFRWLTAVRGFVKLHVLVLVLIIWDFPDWKNWLTAVRLGHGPPRARPGPARPGPAQPRPGLGRTGPDPGPAPARTARARPGRARPRLLRPRTPTQM